MLDISKKIDGINLEILKTVKEIADKLNIEFYLVGATVRDMILNYVYGILIYRKTNDIDFAIRLKNWDQYNILAEEIGKRGFIKDPKIMHRFRYLGMLTDFIPFGDLSNKRGTITWPDKDQKELNIIGFEDAYKNTEELLIQADPEIKIKTASVESLVMLKIFSWNERTLDLRIKDAKDLYIIITTYLQAGNEEKLFNEHADIVDDNFDYELGGARLLGRDISKIASAHSLNSLLEILQSEELNDLVKEMTQYESITHKGDEGIKWCVKLLESLLLGLTD